MAMTVRLPDDLQEGAREYARWLGMSVNALVALALRERMERAPITRAGHTVLLSASAPPAAAEGVQRDDLWPLVEAVREPGLSRQQRRKRLREVAKATVKGKKGRR